MLRVQVEPQALEVAPGSPGTVRVRAVNGSQQVEEYAVDVIGVDAAWVRADPARVTLLPGAQASVAVTLAVPAHRPPESGTRVLGIRFRSVAGGAGRVEEVALTIGAMPAAELVVEPQQARGSGGARFRARVTNTGNTPLEIAVSGEDLEGAVTVTVTPPSLRLRPGEQREARIDVRARRGWTGPEVLRPVLVRGLGGPTELTATATFTQRSRVASGLRRGAVVLAAVALVGGTILAAQLLVGDGVRSGPASGSGLAGTSSPATAAASAAPVPPDVAAVAPDPAPQPPGPPPSDGDTEADTSEEPTPTPGPGDPFLGAWRNADPATGEITRITIAEGGAPDLPVVHAWGNCTPTDCDWGQVQGEVVGDGLYLEWDQGFVLRTMTISEIAPGNLLVATFSDYTDDRESRLSEETFVPD